MAIRLSRGQDTGENNQEKSQDYENVGDIIERTPIKSRTGINASSQDSDHSNNNKIKIIIDEPAKEGVLDFQYYSKNLANIIRETTPPKFAVGIFGKWGSGKTTLMKMIKQKLEEEDKDHHKILTVWFDAWRYEGEKFLAVIPFLRQIRIALDNDLAKKENGKAQNWKVLRRGVERTLTAFMDSIGPSIAPQGSPVSASFNFEKFVNSLKSKGSTWIHNERIQFQEHSTDYLEAALIKLDKENPDSRIVVFVDDLDRCTPAKALEVLESIKSFFDINGIVYVIGMDSESINHIIKEKYGDKDKDGKDSNINGMDYLEKIVQLPFQIPVWKPEDLSESIEKIIIKELEGSKLAGEFENENRKSLIVKAIKPNPRQVKRFVNNLILAKEVFDKDIDTLIVVQALNFRSEWNNFLELISRDDELRDAFFRDYYSAWKSGIGIIDLNKDSKDKYNAIAAPPEILDIFQKLLNQKDDSLRSFLDAGADVILRDIETMEDYRRALEATKLKKEDTEWSFVMDKQGPRKKFLLKLLKAGKVEDFNNLHFDLWRYQLDFSYADLSDTNLTGARLSKANLSGADLLYADFSYSILSEANLTGADVKRAKLSNVYLNMANLSGADLSDTNLTGAMLSKANLSGADVKRANLSGADLSDTNLSGADLSEADLSDTLLHGVDLSGARLYPNSAKGADFKDAVIDDMNLLEQLKNLNAKNVPENVKETAKKESVEQRKSMQ